MMSNFEFGQMVIANAAPTLAVREQVLTNALYLKQVGSLGYIRVHALKVASATTFYAAVSYKDSSSGNRVLTYLAGTIRCSKKDDGYWLAADCFLATASVPFNLYQCPVDIFKAGEALGLTEKVDVSFKEGCQQHHKAVRNAEAVRKGAVFRLDTDAPSIVLQGERATFAVVLNKRTARYIEPVRGVSTEADISELLSNFTPVDDSEVPVMSVKADYKQAGGLLFERNTAQPVLKGRIAFQGEEKRLAAQHRRLKKAIFGSNLVQEFAARFQSPCWLS